jgi:alpha-tubulin suppressor-like RCC1 family protein
LAVGSSHALAIQTNGSVVSWGMNLSGLNLTNLPAGLMNGSVLDIVGSRCKHIRERVLRMIA